MMMLCHVTDTDSCKEYVFLQFTRFVKQEIKLAELEQEVEKALAELESVSHEAGVEKGKEEATEAYPSDVFGDLFKKYGSSQ